MSDCDLNKYADVNVCSIVGQLDILGYQNITLLHVLNRRRLNKWETKQTHKCRMFSIIEIKILSSSKNSLNKENLGDSRTSNINPQTLKVCESDQNFLENLYPGKVVSTMTYKNIWRFGNSATLKTNKYENNYFWMSYGTHSQTHLSKTTRKFTPIISYVKYVYICFRRYLQN